MEFHVAWHRAPASCLPGGVWQSPTGAVSTLAPAGGDLAAPWALSFEEALDALARLERLYVEPDGSFVWRPEVAQQVDGQLSDRAGRLILVELHGRCSGANIDRLAATLNPTHEPLAVQLIREGVYLPWHAWRSLLA